MPERPQRRRQLQSRFKDLQIDGLLVSFLPNVRYLTGFTGSNAILALTPEDGSAVLFTDGRYQAQVAQEADCRWEIKQTSLWLAAAAWVNRRKLRRIGLEAARVTMEQQTAFAAKLNKSAKIIGIGREVEKLRLVKSAGEIEAIHRSVLINSLAYAAALARFRAGMTENELAAEINYQMRRAGADGTAFDTIVASGPNSALPHAHPTSAPIQPDRLLLIDMGALCEGYTSDMTRVVVPGRITAEAKRLYQAVAEAQLAAIDVVKPGVKAVKVDEAARQVLRKYSLDGLFNHSTGHGLGLEIHEAPRLGKKETLKLAAGMVITIEPGAYKEGFGGVRIEDTVLVTETGCRVLTPTAKKLVAI
jgi:Xaa-Pro aminopeptidase